MARGDSVRRLQVMREEARDTLKMFLLSCGLLIPTEKRTHFWIDFRHFSIDLKLADSATKQAMSRNRRYTDAFMRILEATVNGSQPEPSDLELLRHSLNKPFERLEYQRGRRGYPPYAEAGKKGIRATAEYLLNYLNQSDVCGPVHAICETCGRLLVQKRGGRKYCWKGCRELAHRYEKRKEYLKEWQRQDRQSLKRK